MTTVLLPPALLFLFFIVVAFVSDPRWLGYAAAGRLRIGSGALMIASAYAIIPVLIQKYGNSTFAMYGESCAIAVSWIGAAVLIAEGRSNLAAAKSLVADSLSGPRLLYLRPFRTDGRTQQDPPLARGERRAWWWRVTAPVRFIIEGWVMFPHLTFSRFFRRTFPDRLAHALRRVGPIEQVGTRPLERMEPGPLRVPASGADWKEDVHRRLQRARAVILHIGVSEGMLWELRDTVATVPPTAVFLHVPRGYSAAGKAAARAEYDHFRAATADVFPRPLPDHRDGAQFVYFEPDWTPRLLAPVWPAFRRSNRVGASGEQGRILRLLSGEFAPSRLRVALQFIVAAMLLVELQKLLLRLGVL